MTGTHNMASRSPVEPYLVCYEDEPPYHVRHDLAESGEDAVLYLANEWAIDPDEVGTADGIAFLKPRDASEDEASEYGETTIYEECAEDDPDASRWWRIAG